MVAVLLLHGRCQSGFRGSIRWPRSVPCAAILKATTVCTLEPDRAARFMVDKGYATDYAQQTLRGLTYMKWREYDPEDSLRFWALRLREAGMIKSTPQKLMAQATDWRFLNELKKELKG